MTETCKHHLFLRDQEVRIILEALEQYDPVEADGNHGAKANSSRG